MVKFSLILQYSQPYRPLMVKVFEVYKLKTNSNKVRTGYTITAYLAN